MRADFVGGPADGLHAHHDREGPHIYVTVIDGQAHVLNDQIDPQLLNAALGWWYVYEERSDSPMVWDYVVGSGPGSTYGNDPAAKPP